jgi:ATP-binding cassette subfamily C (CFTR/MRP) protein 4
LEISSLDGQSSGQIINLLGNDGTRIDNAVLFFPYLLIGPMQSIVVIILLIKMTDTSILSGLILLAFSIPAQALSGKLLDRLR